MDLLAFKVRRLHTGRDAEGPHGRHHAGRVLLRSRRYLQEGSQGGGCTQDHQAGELLVEADRTTAGDAGAPVKPAGASGLRRRRLLTAWLFMVPLLIINVLVILGPSVATIYYSLTDWAGIGPAEFVGLQNYRDLLADGDFWMAMWHNVIWTILFLTVPIFMGLLGAFLLSQTKRFQTGPHDEWHWAVEGIR